MMVFFASSSAFSLSCTPLWAGTHLIWMVMVDWLPLMVCDVLMKNVSEVMAGGGFA